MLACKIDVNDSRTTKLAFLSLDSQSIYQAARISLCLPVGRIALTLSKDRTDRPASWQPTCQ
jgi:hypothetical protein